MISTDHKVVGLRYGLTSLGFLLLGFLLILLVRWQHAWPTAPVPLVGAWLGSAQAVDGVLLPEFFNQLTSMHGTIMVFLAVVPLAVGGFGTYLVPTLIGARQMAFPRLHAAGYWLYLAAGITMLAGFVLPGGAASAGWTAYPPLASLAGAGQTTWLAGMSLLIASSLISSVTMIVTIVQLRAPGAEWLRLPFFVWSQLVTAFLLLLAFPPLQAASVLQLMDRVAGTSFFLPSGLMVSGQALAVSGGGSPLLWQHLFWFLAHPEVYVLILPALGIVAEVIASATGRPLWGYRAMVASAVFMGAMSFLVWAHHMFLTGMGPTLSTFFQVTTMIISVPSVVIGSSLVLSLRGGPIRFTVPAIFALAFLPMFGLGGLTGLPLGLAASDIPLHDTTYVIGHFHYVVAPGTLFALFAGIYHWFPAITGRRLHTGLGHVHFWTSLVAMNGIFLPMFLQGLAGMNRRLYDGGRSYQHAAGLDGTFELQAWAAGLLGVAQVVFIVNVAWSLRQARQTAAPEHELGDDAVPFGTVSRRDTGVSNPQLGIWLFLASGAMLFGALFSAYALIATASASWPSGRDVLSLTFGAVHTAVLAAVAGAAWQARAVSRRGGGPAHVRWWLLVSTAMAALFLVLKGLEYRDELRLGLLPALNMFLASYYTLTGVLAVHVAGGVAANLWAVWGALSHRPETTGQRTRALALYWTFVDLAWLIMFVLLYLT